MSIFRANIFHIVQSTETWNPITHLFFILLLCLCSVYVFMRVYGFTSLRKLWILYANECHAFLLDDFGRFGVVVAVFAFSIFFSIILLEWIKAVLLSLLFVAPFSVEFFLNNFTVDDKAYCMSMIYGEYLINAWNTINMWSSKWIFVKSITFGIVQMEYELDGAWAKL